MTAKKPAPEAAFEEKTTDQTVATLTAQVEALTALLSQRGMIPQGNPEDVVAAHQAQIRTKTEPEITKTVSGNTKKVNYA